MTIETLKGNSKQKTEKSHVLSPHCPRSLKHGSMPPTLADIVYCSLQTKFSRLVRKFSNMNALFTCVI